jgi:hypothetical protein
MVFCSSEPFLVLLVLERIEELLRVVEVLSRTRQLYA